MSENSYVPEMAFSSLIISISSSAWIGLGKISDPVTGKINQDLKSSKFAIDTLIMLREKTKGNLERDEERLLNGVIADLQANYAETVFSEGKGQEEAKSQEGEGEGTKKE